MAEDDLGRLQQLGLGGDELGQGALDRFSVDVAPARGGQYGNVDVGELVEDPGPVAGGVLVEQRAVGGLDHVHQGAAVAPVTLVAGPEMAHRLRGQLGVEVGQQLFHPLLPLLPRDPEVAEAHLVRLVHLGMAPDARVQAGVHLHADPVTEFDRLATGNADHLVERHPGLFHDPYRLVAADDGGPGLGGDAFRSVQMIEVGVTDQDPIRLLDVVGPQARPGGAVCSVDVGIEKDRLAAGT